MRVSAFLFLHRIQTGESDRRSAEQDLKRIWEPDGVWREFMNAELAKMGQMPL
jgi:hypothetical protein